ncbi:MAG TPA: hypothetical protein PLP23_11280 [Panacibacter sp.]|nr:hypothetical protein [Panacibacter sp.]
MICDPLSLMIAAGIVQLSTAVQDVPQGILNPDKCPFAKGIRNVNNLINRYKKIM